MQHQQESLHYPAIAAAVTRDDSDRQASDNACALAARGGSTMDHCPLDHYAVVRVTGADAVPFLQGQLTQDVARVGPHALLRAALNTPQGRVVALPWLFADDDALRLLLPAGLVVPLAERLRRYVLRAKVRLEAPEPGLA